MSNEMFFQITRSAQVVGVLFVIAFLLYYIAFIKDKKPSKNKWSFFNFFSFQRANTKLFAMLTLHFLIFQKSVWVNVQSYETFLVILTVGNRLFI